MRAFTWTWLVVVATGLSGCLNLQVPPPPGLAPPGVISGRILWQRPGRLQAEPARGASIFVLGSNLGAAADDDGRFLLEGLVGQEGALLIRFDGDGDGEPDRQRSFQLKDIGAGRGRQVSLGEVTLAEGAAISGRILLGDVADSSGHFGTVVFVPGLPLTAFTQADGTFSLEGLAEGLVQIAVMRNGYQPYVWQPLAVRGGEELTLSRVVLPRDPAPAASGILRGRVVGVDGEPLAGVTISTRGDRSTTSDQSGEWRLMGLPADRYDVLFSMTGRLPAALYNMFVAGTEETVAPSVLLASGQSPSTTPSLVGEISMSGDGGQMMADAGADGGVLDAGVFAVTIASARPLVLPFPGNIVGVAALVTPAPPPDETEYEWAVSPPGVVVLANPTSWNVGLVPVATGDFSLSLKVTVAGQSVAALPLQGRVEGPKPELLITDAGASALALWIEAEGVLEAPASAAVTSRGLFVDATFKFNAATNRVVAVFDSPQPNMPLELLIPSLRLTDGGVAAVTGVKVNTPALEFGAPTSVAAGSFNDYIPGVAYASDALLVMARHADAASDTFVVTTPLAVEASIPDAGWDGEPQTRRLTTVGSAAFALYSPAVAFERDQAHMWKPSFRPPPGPVFVMDGAVSAVNVSSALSSRIEVQRLTKTGWILLETFDLTLMNANALVRADSAAAGQDGAVYVVIIERDQSVGTSLAHVWKKPIGGVWGALRDKVPGFSGGRLAAASTGLVLVGASAAQIYSGTLSGSSWKTVILDPNASSWTPLDIIARGSQAYLALGDRFGSGGMRIFVINPANTITTSFSINVGSGTTVPSAELAFGEYGELAVAWSESPYMTGTYGLWVSEMK